MLARVYILLFVVVVAVVVVVDALLNYCEFRHCCTPSRLLRISSWPFDVTRLATMPGCKSGHIKLNRVNSRRIKIRVDLRRVNIRVICVASH
jgi:hypothetical protein